MKFENMNKIIYCKDVYYKEVDTNNFYFNTINGLQYYRGYLIHRIDGPAVMYNLTIENTTVYEWYKNGKKHREDGPAEEWDDGFKEWWLNGIEYSKEEYLNIINVKNKKKILNNLK